MQPALEYLPRNAGESFVARFFDYPYFPTPWHFHPEYEIVLVTESIGKCFIGDQISRFEPGDLALIGPYLPHTYQNDERYYEQRTELRAKSIVVHFREDTFGTGFLLLPEAHRIAELLKQSVRGIAFKGETNELVSTKLHELLTANELTKWLKLIEILDILSHDRQPGYICSSQITGQNKTETIRMNKVIDYVVNNFEKEINVADAAALAGMAPTSFSRYFSARTRKPFITFVNEVRLSNASKLLIETTKSITEVCLGSGFNNLSNFNRQFRQKYNYNPVAFRKQYQNRLQK